MLGCVDEDLTRLAFLWEVFHRSVGLNTVHLLDLLLGLCGLDLTSVEPKLEITLLKLVKAHLLGLAILHLALFLSLGVGLRPETRA